MHQLKGNNAAAEQLYLRALRMKEKLLGRNHPDFAKTLNNLAVLYESEQRFSEAESLYKRAVSILQKRLRADHPSLITALNSYTFASSRSRKLLAIASGARKADRGPNASVICPQSIVSIPQD